MSEKRENVVKVYFTDEEFETIQQKAKKEGLKLSPYLRTKGLLQVPFSISNRYEVSMKRIQEEWTWTKVKKTKYHGGSEDKEKVDQHQIFMTNCVNDPEFQEKLKQQKQKVERAILLASRPIPKGGI